MLGLVSLNWITRNGFEFVKSCALSTYSYDLREILCKALEDCKFLSPKVVIDYFRRFTDNTGCESVEENTTGTILHTSCLPLQNFSGSTSIRTLLAQVGVRTTLELDYEEKQDCGKGEAEKANIFWKNSKIPCTKCIIPFYPALWNSDCLLRDRKWEILGYYGSKEMHSSYCFLHLLRFSENYSHQCRLKTFMQTPTYTTCFFLGTPFSECILYSGSRFLSKPEGWSYGRLWWS